MAIMLPAAPKDYTISSLENLIFEALQTLSDDYYIFHSYRMLNVNEGVLYEGEIDFVIFNRKKGILCIEAKAGKVQYLAGRWCYGSGEPMKGDGPYAQASSNKWKLLRLLEKSNAKDLAKKCKFLHAVWFPSIHSKALESISFPSEAEYQVTFCAEALKNPEPDIERIFNFEAQNNVETNLSESEAKRMLGMFLCPNFELIPSTSFDMEVKKMKFLTLLNEQTKILNFLEEQKTAIINGVAGTGKTLIAVEKAKRHGDSGEKVLFLCYNSQLKDYLSKTHAHDNVTYFTIDGLACTLCNSSKPDYDKLGQRLEDQFIAETFPYKHIVIDEGQDFGQDNIEESNIVSLLQDIITDDTIGGTFYIFYDKLQLVQGTKIPSYFAEADCKLTLYKNCRNTINIATTSMRPLTNQKIVYKADSVKGESPGIHFLSKDAILTETIDKIIEENKQKGILDTVILTCKTDNDSILAQYCEGGYYKKRNKFTTCRKFKGLEADAVILLDITEDIFHEERIRLFYVGSSRARIKLDLVTQLDDDACKRILENYFGNTCSNKRSKRLFAGALNTVIAEQ